MKKSKPIPTQEKPKFDTKEFEDNSRILSERLVTVMTALTPGLLISCILLLALFNGYLEWLHYRNILGSYAAIIPGIVFTVLRFGSGLGGIHMIMHKDAARGFLFVIVSITLTIWATTHLSEIATSIAQSPDQLSNAKWFTGTALWTALVGEIMIAAYMQGMEEKRMQILKDTERKRMQKINGNNQTPNYSQNRYSSISNQIGFKTSNQEVLLNLQKAKNNLAAYESKYRNGVGNPDSMLKGVERWRIQVDLLEEKLK